MVLDSQLQTPLGLQDQDAPAVRKTCRSVLFSSDCLSCQNPAAVTKRSVRRSLRTAFAHAGGQSSAISEQASARNGAIAVVNGKLLRGNGE